MTPLARGLTVGQALPAMTAVQALVAMGTFALSVLAPVLGLDLGLLGLVGALIFGVGALSSAGAGWLIARFGDLRLAALCMLAVALSMACLLGEAWITGAARWSLWPAALLLGLAFGPETPASASVLARITPLAQRPWVFSVRQTGNQIGAMAASLVLPLVLAWQTAGPFALVAVLAVGVAAWCERLSRRDLGAAATVEPARSEGGGLAEVARSAYLRLLTLATVVYMATQVCLNFFLVSHLVRVQGMPVAQAAAWAAVMQGGGLIGRLLWGRVARNPAVVPARLLGALGVAMGVVGLLLLAGDAARPAGLMVPLLFLLGLSASGWNGLMVAEIARVAGIRRAGAVTGAVLLFGYGGLALAPLGFAAVGEAAGSGPAFCLLLAASLLVGIGLLWRSALVRNPPSPT